MADPTSGVFRDPAGNLMTLTSTSPEAFRVLVTRKLERGWAFAKESPVVKPLFDETRLALPPAYEEITINVGDGFYGDVAAKVAEVTAAIAAITPATPAPAFAFPTANVYPIPDDE